MGTYDNTQIDGRIPITIGITGHRNIHEDAVGAISDKLREFFRRLKETYPDSPLILISPLAEGADQLVASLALEMGMGLLAVLPMEQAEYKKDFEGESVNQTFDGLLNQSVLCKTLLDFDPVDQRNLCYANVGKWVVDNSDIVLALWDGDLNELTGGTGEIVNYSLTGELPGLKDHFDSKAWTTHRRPVVHVHTPRQTEGSPDLSANVWFYNDAQSLSVEGKSTCSNFDDMLSELNDLGKINQFNLTAEAKAQEDGYPLVDCDIKRMPQDLQNNHQLYMRSDLTANAYQKSFRNFAHLFYGLSAALMVTFLLYFRVFPFTEVLAFYILVYVGTAGVSFYIKHSDFQRKYHVYRAMGELSRLFFFLNLSEAGAGKKTSVLDNFRELQYITRKVGHDNHWVVEALRKIRLFNTDEPIAADIGEPMALVRKHWVEDQGRYFKKARRRDERQLNTINTAGSILFGISFLAGLSLFLLGYLEFQMPDIAKSLLGVSIGVSAGLGGILKTYVYTMGLSELTGQYRLMEELFEDAIRRLDSDKHNHQAIFEQLWWEALMENIEWFSMKEARLIKTLNINKSMKSLARMLKA